MGRGDSLGARRRPLRRAGPPAPASAAAPARGPTLRPRCVAGRAAPPPKDCRLGSRSWIRAGWRLLFVLTVLAVAWLAFTPHPPPRATTGWDKANHALAFCAMALAALGGWPRAPGWAVPAALLGYGVLIECVQAVVPGRSAEWADLLADAAGIALGLLLVHGGRRWRRT